MRRFNSDLSDKSKENSKTPYLDILAVGLVQFFLSIPILCYGVYLMQLEDLCSLKTGLWTAILFVSMSKIANPWVKSYCKYIDNVKHKIHKRNIVVTVIILFSNLLFTSFHNTPATIIIFYGIFGGICSSIISAHLNFATAEAFKNYQTLFCVLDQLMKSFCLLVTPHLVLLFINLYGKDQSFMILAALILNIIPICFLIKIRRPQKMRLCKFQTIDRLSIEMSDLNSKSLIQEEPSSSSSDEDEDEILIIEPQKEEDEEINTNEKPAPLPPTSVEKYYQSVGVKILPNIPEESDTEDDDINEINSKRLSRISAILQGINENSYKNYSLSITNLFQPEEVIEKAESEENVTELTNKPSQKKSRCFSISSSVNFNLQLKKKRMKSFCYRSFVRSTFRCLRTPYFYPALISSSITTFLSTIIFATAPYINNNKKHSNYFNTPEESTFLLTVIGFAWLFFLAGYPVFNKLSTAKTKILFLIGHTFLGLSLFFVYHFSYDNFIFFSLTFGLGHGIVTYSENLSNEFFLGKEKWKLLQGSLEVITGIIVIIIYVAIYCSNVEITDILSCGYWIYLFNVILCIIAHLTQKISIYFKHTGRYNVGQFSDFEF